MLPQHYIFVPLLPFIYVCVFFCRTFYVYCWNQCIILVYCFSNFSTISTWKTTCTLTETLCLPFFFFAAAISPDVQYICFVAKNYYFVFLFFYLFNFFLCFYFHFIIHYMLTFGTYTRHFWLISMGVVVFFSCIFLYIMDGYIFEAQLSQVDIYFVETLHKISISQMVLLSIILLLIIFMKNIVVGTFFFVRMKDREPKKYCGKIQLPASRILFCTF